MTPVRCGIVGLGLIASRMPEPSLIEPFGGEQPNSHASGYAALSNTHVVAVCDRNQDRLNSFAAIWRTVWPELRLYADYREMLDRERLDLLSICTQDHLHAQISVDACDAGVRAIFCEKPIATSLSDADRMIAAAEAAGVAMSVNHSRRWLSPSLQAKALLRDGAVGELRQVIRLCGGARAMLFRNGTHFIDQMCFFADSDPVSVSGELDPEDRDYGIAYQGEGGLDPNKDLGCVASIWFANGVRGHLSLSKHNFNPGETTLIGETGLIRLGYGGFETDVELMKFDSDGIWYRQHYPIAAVTRTGIVAAISELIEVMHSGDKSRTTLSSAREARKAVIVIMAILRSNALKGKIIRLPSCTE